MPRLPRIGNTWRRFSCLLTGKTIKQPTVDQARPAILNRTSRTTLEAIGLLRSFGSGEGRTVALQNVCMELRGGELNLLMGPSGSGKSTLLAVISALLRPDAGVVRALGQDLWTLSEKQLEQFRLKHCSYIFQGYNLFPALTARQQLEVVLRWGEKATPSVARKRAEVVLGQLGLAKKAHLRPSQLSGGEKQRVAIARALVKNPTFVFADEPTSALDWENGQHVIELLRSVARDRGATVLVVTHDHRLVPYADRIIEMADGQLRLPSPVPQHDTAQFLLDQTIVDLEPRVQSQGPRLKLREPAIISPR